MNRLLLGAGLAALIFTAGCGQEEAAAPPTDAPETAANQPETGAGETTAAAPETEAGKEAASGSGPTPVPEEKFKTTDTGLKYAVIEEGSGPEAQSHQQVSVHYTGWLKNGEKFDSSRDRGEPFTFVLDHGEVIPGWDQGVKGMKVGEKRQLVIPPDLGYGETGTPGGPIPPNATLVFDVELVRLGEVHQH